jgi:putative ABC transport system permease protein
MLKNYLRIIYRNLLRSKVFSILNIAGLAVGMAAAILIGLWVQNERSTDRFYKNTDRLYQLYSRDKFNGQTHAWPSTPEVLKPVLQTNYPEVETSTRYAFINFLVSAGEKRFVLSGSFADSSFLTMFDFPFLEGNAAALSRGGSSIILTEQLARNLFGKEDAMGKTVRIDSTDDFTVAGVLKDLPANTSFNFQYLLPWSYREKLRFSDLGWGSSSISTFVQLRPGASQTLFDQKIGRVIIDHSDETTQVFTQPMNRLYLYDRDDNGHLVAGRIGTVRLFTLIAIFILLIACINFMNLSTARSERRAREVGIRKVMGAYRGALLLQFIGESILFSLAAFVLAQLLVQISLSGFNQLVGRTLSVDYGDRGYWLFAAGFVLVTGTIAGSYPALYLSSFRPAVVLRGSFRKVNALVTARKALVVLQFTFAIILIIGTIIIERQIEYGKDRDAGYDRNNLVYTFTNGAIANHFDLIKQDLIRSGAAVGVTRSANPITRRWSSGWGYRWQGSTETDTKIQFVQLGSDADFVKTTGVALLQGRDIDVKEYPSDSTAMLLNQSAVKAMQLKNPIGKIVSRDGDHRWTVVGIIKDFILESPFESHINPMMITGPTRFFQVIHIKLNPSNTTAADLALAGKIFKQYNPLYPFEYYFADEYYARKFELETRSGTMAVLFAGLTIFISCLGLFGLASYMAENRIREIGIRKLLGASVGGIATLLSKDFAKLVFVSILLASPIAWFAMDHWLQDYTYRIHIGPWIFIAAGGLAMFIALLTVCYQAIRAAMANPVKSLRAQ